MHPIQDGVHFRNIRSGKLEKRLGIMVDAEPFLCVVFMRRKNAL